MLPQKELNKNPVEKFFESDRIQNMTQEYELSLQHATAIADATETLGRAKISYISGEGEPDLKAGYLNLERASLIALKGATINPINVFPTLAAEARHLGIITRRSGKLEVSAWFGIVNGMMNDASVGLLDPMPAMSERVRQFEMSPR